jgi:hypothetical protein
MGDCFRCALSQPITERPLKRSCPSASATCIAPFAAPVITFAPPILVVLRRHNNHLTTASSIFYRSGQKSSVLHRIL